MATTSFSTSIILTSTSPPTTLRSTDATASSASSRNNPQEPSLEVIIAIVIGILFFMGIIIGLSVLFWQHQERKMARRARDKAECVSPIELEAEQPVEEPSHDARRRDESRDRLQRAELENSEVPSELVGEKEDFVIMFRPSVVQR
ncbi:hypothetical protein BU24DRAFT_456460 [Aaosphaeria arxii CBS 175.79]|uniref:Uncharacterized protein n=1 Tax=Aaosphaeria arxii CBS 175.79 TaxID=1450172 RepID=A0A6A5Y531_9PLEO|nr:uncharacterized protein BU24DRAFT_456460 [Aaosphaeria arxii CBS 175.79]KAF2020376.1 hypothetical protein BU24DRAFT_456460 [Aaosphaeria arxii CBS 175.79]